MEELTESQELQKDHILDLEIRRKLYNFILRNPGIHLREIVRKTNIPYSTLKYHINYLKKRNLITNAKEGGYNRYYGVQSISNEEKKLLSTLRQSIPRKIVLFLLNSCCGSQKEISEEIKKHPTTISFHIKKLVFLGIVEHICFVDGLAETGYKKATHLETSVEVNEKLYKLKDPYMIYDFFCNYRNQLLEDNVDKEMLQFMDIYKDIEIDDRPKVMKRKRSSEKAVADLEEFFYWMFPHPYHV